MVLLQIVDKIMSSFEGGYTSGDLILKYVHMIFYYANSELFHLNKDLKYIDIAYQHMKKQPSLVI